MSKIYGAITLGIISILFLAAVAAMAQPTSNPVAGKRNSPFSPNPKKKETQENKNLGNEKILEISKSDPQPTAGAVNEGSSPSASGETKSAGADPEENPTIAKKTWEVVKRSAKAAAPTEIYKIGPEDILDIRILNTPNKNSTLFTVSQDGTIDYPLAGEEPLQVGGLTSDEISELIKEKIKNTFGDNDVDVKVRDYSSHSISVVGLVENPGKKTLRREAVPLYLIKAEAIIQSRANQLVVRRDKEVTKYDLKERETDDLLIQSGDILEFTFSDPAAQASPKSAFYFIGGNVISGGQKDFHDGITLTQAIFAAGGPKKDKVKKVIIRRKNEQGLLAASDFDLRAIKDGKIADPILQAGDTIEVTN